MKCSIRGIKFESSLPTSFREGGQGELPAALATLTAVCEQSGILALKAAMAFFQVLLIQFKFLFCVRFMI